MHELESANELLRSLGVYLVEHADRHQHGCHCTWPMLVGQYMCQRDRGSPTLQEFHQPQRICHFHRLSICVGDKYVKNGSPCILQEPPFRIIRHRGPVCIPCAVHYLPEYMEYTQEKLAAICFSRANKRAGVTVV